MEEKKEGIWNQFHDCMVTSCVLLKELISVAGNQKVEYYEAVAFAQINSGIELYNELHNKQLFKIKLT